MVEDEEASDPAAEARRGLLERTSGALATLSADAATAGWPFGSVVPFALTPEGAPAILIADIAQHTRNLRSDPRASLLVQQREDAGDPQAGWRVTLLGRMRPVVDAAAVEALHARYVERVPGAPGYLDTHGFGYWVMDVVRARWIGGFGDICWLEAADVLRDPGGEGIGAARAMVVEHMNADHADALAAICEARAGFRPTEARMVDLDRAGFALRTREPERLVHVSFGREIAAADAREVFVSLTRDARQKLKAKA
jgi:hypothetical protein